jgi:hypothetical protein
VDHSKNSIQSSLVQRKMTMAQLLQGALRIELFN